MDVLELSRLGECWGKFGASRVLMSFSRNCARYHRSSPTPTSETALVRAFYSNEYELLSNPLSVEFTPVFAQFFPRPSLIPCSTLLNLTRGSDSRNFIDCFLGLLRSSYLLDCFFTLPRLKAILFDPFRPSDSPSSLYFSFDLSRPSMNLWLTYRGSIGSYVPVCSAHLEELSLVFPS
jgi:hypothetical protein